MAATAEAGSISIRRLAALGMAAVRVLACYGPVRGTQACR